MKLLALAPAGLLLAACTMPSNAAVPQTSRTASYVGPRTIADRLADDGFETSRASATGVTITIGASRYSLAIRMLPDHSAVARFEQRLHGIAVAGADWALIMPTAAPGWYAKSRLVAPMLARALGGVVVR